MVTMLGWLRAEAARASCSKRRKRSLSEENAAGRILIATLRSKRASRARYTSPIPPAPSSSIISYGPSFVPEGRAIAHGIIFPGKGLAVGPTILGWMVGTPEIGGKRNDEDITASRRSLCPGF